MSSAGVCRDSLRVSCPVGAFSSRGSGSVVGGFESSALLVVGSRREVLPWAVALDRAYCVSSLRADVGVFLRSCVDDFVWLAGLV